MKSIIDNGNKVCYICGSKNWIECHHVYNSSARKKSEQYGLKVNLCHYCHNEPPNGIHHNAENERKLKADIQKQAMKHYGWSVEQFRAIFGRNYIY